MCMSYMVYATCDVCHTPVTSRAFMHMQILLYALFPLLEQRYTPCYAKLSGATVILYKYDDLLSVLKRIIRKMRVLFHNGFIDGKITGCSLYMMRCNYS